MSHGKRNGRDPAAVDLIDVQFSPGVESAGDIVARLDNLWRVAKQA